MLLNRGGWSTQGWTKFSMGWTGGGRDIFDTFPSYPTLHLHTNNNKTTTVYFNEVVFPSVLGLTSPMAFPQHSPPPWPVPSIFPTKSLLSTLLSISSWAYLSLHHHLPAVSQFSLTNTTHLSSQHGQTTSTLLQQCHQLPACS